MIGSPGEEGVGKAGATVSVGGGNAGVLVTVLEQAARTNRPMTRLIGILRMGNIVAPSNFNTQGRTSRSPEGAGNQVTFV